MDVNELRIGAHGVVQGHHPVELEAKESIQIPGPQPPGHLWVQGGNGEVAVMAKWQ